MFAQTLVCATDSTVKIQCPFSFSLLSNAPTRLASRDRGQLEMVVTTGGLTGFYVPLLHKPLVRGLGVLQQVKEAVR